MKRPRQQRWSGLGRVLMVGAMSVGALLVSPSLGSASRASISRARSGPSASAARITSLNETGHLRLTSKHNFTLNEKGSASGTIAGAIYVHLTAVSSTRVTVQVNIYPHGGSISGSGSGSYHQQPTIAKFAGSMSFSRGTGKYAHVRGSGLSFSGTIDSSHHDAITVHVSGGVSD